MQYSTTQLSTIQCKTKLLSVRNKNLPSSLYRELYQVKMRSKGWVTLYMCHILSHGGDFSGYNRILGIRFLWESSKNGVEVHFECDFAPFRIQTLAQSHPWYCILFCIVLCTWTIQELQAALSIEGHGSTTLSKPHHGYRSDQAPFRHLSLDICVAEVVRSASPILWLRCIYSQGGVKQAQ